MADKYYTIESDKLEKVVQIFNQETDPKATSELIETEICADWNGGIQHQDWIDSATPQEIADWLSYFHD